MKTPLQAAFGCALGWLAGSLSPASAAVLIKSQAPCVQPSTNYCLIFLPSFSAQVIRRIVFDAPGAGTALVSFHGSMTCANLAGSGNDRFIDLYTQIRSGGTFIDPLGEGGHIHEVYLNGTTLGTSDSFNLSARRVFKIKSAGRYRFHYVMEPNTTDPGWNCTIYNAAFTVTFSQ
jgi:hypothetical protein